DSIGSDSSNNHFAETRKSGATFSAVSKSISLLPENQCEAADDDRPADFHSSVFVSFGKPRAVRLAFSFLKARIILFCRVLIFGILDKKSLSWLAFMFLVR
ncbi:hypothetical protein, partial [Bacillus cereus]